ncbi:uncharacterized protein M421DRAFT_180129 [Didymella exigua CBS 183.55]|uniref:Uncharacterized protein n=1 Tax=Didymella exigua CBS 183.55 TaxID=1150837 RepID=A0A6A5RGK7_9PLEO|nr:uncharacterized protein M421DRAFT_180129 [Didymella exigua CBS 183.55]KAF1927461.1 hypothetical protein M421DRAFT_180129 [Didymella exigua CBS 183.55]
MDRNSTNATHPLPHTTLIPSPSPHEPAPLFNPASASVVTPATVWPSITHGSLSPVTSTTLHQDPYHNSQQSMHNLESAKPNTAVDHGPFYPAASENLILGRMYGPKIKPCRCRGQRHGTCRTRQLIESKRFNPAPMTTLLVKDETFKFLLEDRLGTLHTSELLLEEGSFSGGSASPAFDRSDEDNATTEGLKSAASFSLPTS